MLKRLDFFDELLRSRLIDRLRILNTAVDPPARHHYSQLGKDRAKAALLRRERGAVYKWRRLWYYKRKNKPYRGEHFGL